MRINVYAAYIMCVKCTMHFVLDVRKVFTMSTMDTYNVSNAQGLYCVHYAYMTILNRVLGFTCNRRPALRQTEMDRVSVTVNVYVRQHLPAHTNLSTIAGGTVPG